MEEIYSMWGNIGNRYVLKLFKNKKSQNRPNAVSWMILYNNMIQYNRKHGLKFDDIGQSDDEHELVAIIPVAASVSTSQARGRGRGTAKSTSTSLARRSTTALATSTSTSRGRGRGRSRVTCNNKNAKNINRYTSWEKTP